MLLVLQTRLQRRLVPLLALPGVFRTAAAVRLQCSVAVDVDADGAALSLRSNATHGTPRGTHP
jgi:hypothetical protein